MLHARTREDLAWRFLEQMLLIRRFEEVVGKLGAAKSFPGHYHLYIGQEAAGVGGMAAIGTNDHIVTTHRNHGHIDPRTLVPFDEESIVLSVVKTGRLVVVDEAPLRGGTASEVAATIGQRAFGHLKAPIIRVTRPNVPVPFSPPLEQAITPSADDIVRAVRQLIDK